MMPATIQAAAPLTGCGVEPILLREPSADERPGKREHRCAYNRHNGPYRLERD